MIRVLLLFSLASFTLLRALAQQPVLKYAETISVEDLRKHLTYIASDELEGRDTGSEGQRKAAEYIANHFKSLGLKSFEKENPDKAYYQQFMLYRTITEEITINTSKGKLSYPNDFFCLIAPDIAQPKPLAALWAGTATDWAQMDTINLNPLFAQSWLVITNDAENQRSNPQGMNYNRFLDLAKKAGAQGLIVAMPQDAFNNSSKSYKYYAENPSLNLNPPREGIPLIYMGFKSASKLLGIAEKQLYAAQQNKKKLAIKPSKSSNSIKSIKRTEEVATENVLGYVEGSVFPNEFVILTAHYDHLGVNENGEIFNGADDDGSGTVAVMEIARAFAKAAEQGIRPLRSVMFMTVSGEEKGLLGSKYYVNHHLVPLDQTVVNLNIDMVGRIDKTYKDNPDYVYLIGSDKLSTELHEINEMVNMQCCGLKLDYKYNSEDDPNRFYYRSDHYNFAKNGIPVIFYFNGTHEDYHRPTDVIDKIDYDKIRKISRLIFNTAWEVANRSERIVVDKP